jgi:hypothetical protein
LKDIEIFIILDKIATFAKLKNVTFNKLLHSLKSTIFQMPNAIVMFAFCVRHELRIDHKASR